MSTTTQYATSHDVAATRAPHDSAVASELLANARALGPLLQENADAAERARRLPQSVFTALAEAGLQRMFTPRALGGLEVDPVTAARVIEEVASFDSAAGWALQPGNVGAWWSCRLPAAGALEVYGPDPSALMAAAFHPPQRATRVPGGYRINGRGPLASNIHDSPWLLLSALVMAGDQPNLINGRPEMVAVVMKQNEVEIVDTWYTLGMRSTDSNDVVANDVFVPESRCFALVPVYEPNVHFSGPLYRFPSIGIAAITVAPVILAIARGAITELRNLALGKTPFGSSKTLRERANVQTTLARAEGLLRSARGYFYETLSTTWQRTVAGEAHSLEQRADLLLSGVHAVQSAVEVTDLMHRLAGTSAIYERSGLERDFRDAHTLRHHGFVSESKLESVGQIFLGLQPEFMMIGF